jgi:hypothetical protein
MEREIVFVLPGGERHEFKLIGADLVGCTRRDADDWLGKEFVAAGCVPSDPVGKLILADKVIQLARTIPAKTLVTPTPWLHEYLRAVACALERPVVSIDLVEGKLGY